MSGCRTEWGGRRYDDPCDECRHALIAHTVDDRVCSICAAVAAILHPVERDQ